MEDKSDYAYLLKVLIIGDSGVGKTSIMLRYADDIFSTKFVSTIGVDFKIATMKIDDKLIKLQLWDTAGQDRYRTIVSSYYRGCHGIFIIFDLTSQTSFDNIESWYDEISNNLKDINQSEIILVGNKCDLEKNRVISHEMAKTKADKFSMHYIETSAKTNENIFDAFYKLSKNAITNHPTKGIVKKSLSETIPIKNSKCC